MSFLLGNPLTTPTLGKLIKATPTLLYGRKGLPPDVQKLLEKDGDAVIQRAVIFRTPLSGALRFALNITSLGAFNKKVAESPYDTLFHLGLILYTNKGTFTTEKEAVPRLRKGEPKLSKDTQTLNLSLNGKTITLRELFDNGIKQAGSMDTFNGYSAKNNNCQCFVMYLVRGSQLGDENTRAFVKQDTKEIFKGMDWYKRFTDTVTDLGKTFDIIQQGGKIKGGELPDYEHLNWGSFTKQFKAYHRKNPSIKSLDEFARHILANPSQFQATTRKRASFYLNVIEKKHMSGGRMNDYGDPVLRSWINLQDSMRDTQAGIQKERDREAERNRAINQSNDFNRRRNEENDRQYQHNKHQNELRDSGIRAQNAESRVQGLENKIRELERQLRETPEEKEKRMKEEKRIFENSKEGKEQKLRELEALLKEKRAKQKGSGFGFGGPGLLGKVMDTQKKRQAEEQKKREAEQQKRREAEEQHRTYMEGLDKKIKDAQTELNGSGIEQHHHHYYHSGQGGALSTDVFKAVELRDQFFPYTRDTNNKKLKPTDPNFDALAEEILRRLNEIVHHTDRYDPRVYKDNYLYTDGRPNIFKARRKAQDQIAENTINVAIEYLKEKQAGRDPYDLPSLRKFLYDAANLHNVVGSDTHRNLANDIRNRYSDDVVGQQGVGIHGNSLN